MNQEVFAVPLGKKKKKLKKRSWTTSKLSYLN